MQKVITTDKLTKTFGNFTAVNAISFDVYKGEIFGFLGQTARAKRPRFVCFAG